jgi:hypothetical protein
MSLYFLEDSKGFDFLISLLGYWPFLRDKVPVSGFFRDFDLVFDVSRLDLMFQRIFRIPKAYRL